MRCGHSSTRVSGGVKTGGSSGAPPAPGGPALFHRRRCPGAAQRDPLRTQSPRCCRSRCHASGSPAGTSAKVRRNTGPMVSKPFDFQHRVRRNQVLRQVGDHVGRRSTCRPPRRSPFSPGTTAPVLPGGAAALRMDGQSGRAGCRSPRAAAGPKRSRPWKVGAVTWRHRSLRDRARAAGAHRYRRRVESQERRRRSSRPATRRSRPRTRTTAPRPRSSRARSHRLNRRSRISARARRSTPISPARWTSCPRS